MQAVADRYLKVSVVFQRRDDGGLQVYSDEVPGFVLSGADAHAVFADVIPALTFIFEHNKGLKVEFGPVVDIQEGLEELGFLPSTGVVKREYVTPLQRAA
jgi:hypothetical protein